MVNEGMAAAASALSISWAETIMRQLPKSDWASNLTKCRHRQNRHSASRPVCCYVYLMTWSWSSLGENTFILRSKERDSINWKRPIDMCSILWVCCFLSRWYFKENDFFLFFRPSLTLSFKKVNAASVQFHVLARKLEKKLKSPNPADPAADQYSRFPHMWVQAARSIQVWIKISRSKSAHIFWQIFGHTDHRLGLLGHHFHVQCCIFICIHISQMSSKVCFLSKLRSEVKKASNYFFEHPSNVSHKYHKK